jgi:hypothetical protein
MIANLGVATKSIILEQVHPASCGDIKYLVYVFGMLGYYFLPRQLTNSYANFGRHNKPKVSINIDSRGYCRTNKTPFWPDGISH